MSQSPPLPRLSLEATVFTIAQLLHAEAPQLALAGRSNVGKSSLLNAMAGRKNMAKVSATPGKTRSINFYRIEPRQAFIVDLPGYGYAKCSREERDKWARLIGHYLRETPGLKALVLLLDARLAPQRPDLDLLGFAMALALPVLPVLTKADKCSKRELAATAKAWGAFVNQKELHAVSSVKGLGLMELWQKMIGLLPDESPSV